ncbi:ATPase [Planctomycetales bacterium]|nr:ATPase [Planctomycetales bacterium]GHT36915.1 ATPase [Planctomycetales bacterium]
MNELEGFWIRNYKCLKQVGIGACFPQLTYIDDEDAVLPFPLDTVTLFTGHCGTGKSSVFDVFSFISDILKHGLEAAVLKRGGYDSIYTSGGKGTMSFGFRYRENQESEPATYAVSIAVSKNKVPFIESEVLVYRRGKESLPVFFIQNGAKSIRFLAPDERLGNDDLTKIEFTDYNHLGLAALENHPKFPVFASLRQFFENWVYCNFTPDPSYGLSNALPRFHSSPRGTRLFNMIQYMIKRYGSGIHSFLTRISVFLPGVRNIALDASDFDKPLVYFEMEGIIKPLPITHLSDAAVRLFMYVLLMEEDYPAPLLAVEEPENGLDRLYCWRLTQQIQRFNDFPRGSQLFMTTHHPGIADILHPAQVWLFGLNQEGFTTVERAADNIQIQNIAEDNSDLSPRWFSEGFENEI